MSEVVEVVDPDAVVEVVEVTDPDQPDTVVQIWVPGTPGPTGEAEHPVILLEADQTEADLPEDIKVGSIILQKAP